MSMADTFAGSPPPAFLSAPPSAMTTRKRTLVPILLEAFPTPPTHIPSSPLPTPPVSTAINPPPSLPPAVPLPPIPGPSPISEQETLLFMASNRSRRSSRVSVASSIRSTHSSPSLSRRDSGGDPGASSATTSPSITPLSLAQRRGSIASARSVRSFSSNGSLSAPVSAYPRSPSYGERSPTIGYSISEEDPADLTTIDMGGLVSISPMPLSDMDDVEQENVLSSIPPLSRCNDPKRPLHDESISSIDMHDLPANDDDSEVDPNTEAQALHLQMRAKRSTSEMHKKILRSRNSSPSRASARPLPEAVPPLPTPHQSAGNDDRPVRAASPDISTILAATPRPRRSSTSRSQSRSGSRPRVRSGMRRHVSEGVPSSQRTSASSLLSRRTSEGSVIRVDSPADLAYMKDETGDDSFVSDYGIPLNGEGVLAPETGTCPDRELDDSDSDSSIDLHTPLPHLMLRHGLLSPNSKLLPRASSPAPQSSDGRPGSILSVASTSVSAMTKSGIYKDERDTPKRRVRHRDGRLLRGGIGLTTGLGWSDSEDEDAPSPLTRRISSLNLSRRSSASSMQSSAHPLSRSFSSEAIFDDDEGPNRQSKLRLKPRASQPPTSWPKRSPVGRASTSSAGSSFSLPISIPENVSVSAYPAATSIRQSVSDSSVRPNRASGATRDASDTVHTSSSSTLSLPLPVTPEGGDDAPPLRKMIDKNKVLPPLPGQALRKIPSNMSFKSTAANLGTSGGPAVPRPRTYSSASSVSSVGATANHASSNSPPPTPAIPPTPSFSYRVPTSPRPLHLAQISPGLQPGEQLPRPGQVLTYNRNLHDQQRMRAASGPARPSGILRPTATPLQPARSPSDSAKPKPRTGTGMVYRTSSNPLSSGRPSRMRMPGTSSSLGGTSVTGRPPHSPAIPQAIAL